jgi:hypothetical protein
MPRLSSWCDTAARVLTALLIIASILAMSAVYYRGRALIQMTAAVLGIIWSLRLLASRKDKAEIGKVESRNGFQLSAFCFLLCLVILLFIPLVPLPPRVLQILSPRAFVIATQALPGWPAHAPFDDLRQALDLQPSRTALAAQLPSAGAWRPLSLVRHDTALTLSLGAGYALVAAVMAFYPWPGGGLAAVTGVLSCLIAVGTFEALYGVWQTTTGYSRLYWYDCPRSACMGSYLNRDHYAGLLEMIFPIAVARAAAWYATLRLEAGALRHAPSLFRTRDYIDAFSGTLGRTICAAAFALLLLVAMAVSGSRSAFGASVAALLIMVPLRPRAPLLTKEGEGGARIEGEGRVAGPRSTSLNSPLNKAMVQPVRHSRERGNPVLSRGSWTPAFAGVTVRRVFQRAVKPFARRGSGWRRFPFLSGGIVALAILWLTFPQLFGRLWEDDPRRPAFAADTFNMALEFPLFGIGLGNFATVFPLFRALTANVWQFGVSDAHNDYLQWIAEVGLPAALLTFGLLGAAGRRVLRALRAAQEWAPQGLTRWGLAAGVLALLFHSLTDFNLHIPANALVFAVLLGSLIRLTGEELPDSDLQNAKVRSSRLLPGLALLLCVLWAGFIWRQWDAAAAYARVYPNIRLTDLVSPFEEPSPEEALRLTRRAAALVPSAPQFQWGLGEQLVARGVDPATPSTELDSIFDTATIAYMRSLWAAPLQPQTLLALVAAVEPIYQPGSDFEADPLYDLVHRAALLAPYDRSLQLTIAGWYLARWDSFPEKGRPQAGKRIEAALEIAARSPDLRQQVAAARAEYLRLRDGGLRDH